MGKTDSAHAQLEDRNENVSARVNQVETYTLKLHLHALQTTGLSFSHLLAWINHLGFTSFGIEELNVLTFDAYLFKNVLKQNDILERQL